MWIGNEARDAVLFQLNAAITDVCFWGKITGIDGDIDFPVTVGEYQVIEAGTYETIEDIFAALAAVGFNVTNDFTFLQCCTSNLQDYAIDFVAQDESDKTLHINFYRGLVYVDNSANNQESDFQTNNIAFGNCYSLAVKYTDVLAYSNLFQRIAATGFLTFLSYYNYEDAYDFHYPADYLVNKLWLPLHVKNPVYPEERKIYRKSNKQYKVQFATIEKQWLVVTDWFSDNVHGRLTIALAHDIVHFYSDRIDEDVFKKDEYSIAWEEYYPPGAPTVAPASFNVLQVFAGRNSNCERRPVCVALPEPPVPPDCETVAIIGELALPDAVVGEFYEHTEPLSGTPPYSVVKNTGPAWMTIEIVSGLFVKFSGTPDVSGEGIEVSFTLSNCGGDIGHQVPYADYIDVTEEAIEGNGNLENTTSFDVEDVLWEDYGVCTPYADFPVTPATTGTFSAPTGMTGKITVRFADVPGGVGMNISINGSLVETKTETLTGLVITSDNDYTINSGDLIEILIY